MITWMTRMSFLDTAQDLGDALLAQTERESLELLEALLGQRDLEPQHAVGSKMWTGYEPALAAYICSLSSVLALRGLPSPSLPLRAKALIVSLQRTENAPYEPPPWLGDVTVLSSHRSNLVRRWPAEYSGAWKGTPELWPYLVPVVDVDGSYQIVVSKAERAMLASGERKLPAQIKKEVNL